MKIYVGTPMVCRDENGRHTWPLGETSFSTYIIRVPGTGIIRDFIKPIFPVKVQISPYHVAGPGLFDFFDSGNIISYSPTEPAIQAVMHEIKKVWVDYPEIPVRRKSTIWKKIKHPFISVGQVITKSYFTLRERLKATR